MMTSQIAIWNVIVTSHEFPFTLSFILQIARNDLGGVCFSPLKKVPLTIIKYP